MKRLLHKLLILICIVFANDSCSYAATINWTGNSSSNWNNGANWSGGAVPGSGDIAQIGVAFYSANQPTLNASTAISGLIFGPNPTIITGAANPVILTVASGFTLTVNGNITEQHSASNTSPTTSIAQTVVGATGGTIICNGSLLVGNTTAPSALGTLGIATTGNTNMSNLTTMNVNLQTFTITQNVTLNTTSKSGNVLTAIAGTSVPAANVNNPVLNFNNGAVNIAGTIQMTNSAYVSVGAFTGSGVPYAATKNLAQFIVNPASNTTTGTTETLTLSGATPLNINSDGNAAGFVDFNGAGTGSSNRTIIYAGTSAQTAYASTTGLDNSPTTYQNISFSGSGVKTFLTGAMSVSGNWNSTGGKVDLATNGAATTFTGATPSITDNSTGVLFQSVTLTSSSPTLSTTGSFSISSAGVLTLSGTSVLNTTGNLTLLSDATGSASVATLPTGNSISGNVNVQRYVQGNGDINYRGYRLLSSPVNSGGFINLDYIANSTIVTGATTTAGGTVTGNPTIYLYNESLPVNNTSFVSGNFVGVTSTTSTTLGTLSGSTTSTTTLPTGNGYFVYFRGDNINTTNKTTQPFASPENVTFTATGALNQGNVTVNDWYTTNLSFTSTQAAIAKGFNLVGNPYACSIDWDQAGSTGIQTTNLDNTVYIYNAAKKAYASYLAGTSGLPGANWPTTATHNANIIPSGQGFFVHATNTSPKLVFTEAAKVPLQQQASSTNLMLAVAPIGLHTAPPYFRIQLEKDTVNEEDVLLLFNNTASAKYVLNEDAVYLKGNNSVSLSLASADNVALAISQLPLPQISQTIGLNVKASTTGSFQLHLTEIKNIPDLYDIWLKDNYLKDSLDIKHNPTYSFQISADTNSSSLKRFTLVMRVNPGLAYHLLNFAGNKTTGGDQLNWVTENEKTYTSFALQRSTDEGKNFADLAVITSTGVGNYSYLDSSPAPADWYRLKQTDLLGNISYSTVVGIQYANLSNNAVGSRLSVYPNPTADVVNLNVDAAGNSNGNYNIIITNSSGNVVKNVTSSQSNWQGNVSGLQPGMYLMKVIDTINNKIIGTGKFIKM